MTLKYAAYVQRMKAKAKARCLTPEETLERADALTAALLRRGGIHKFKSNVSPSSTNAKDVLRSITTQPLRKWDAKRVLPTHVHLFPRGRGKRPKS